MNLLNWHLVFESPLIMVNKLKPQIKTFLFLALSSTNFDLSALKVIIHNPNIFFVENYFGHFFQRIDFIPSKKNLNSRQSAIQILVV